MEEHMDDYVMEDGAGETTGAGPAPLAGSGAFTSFLLLATGFATMAFAVCLQLADMISWRLVEVGRTLTAHGVEPFSLFLVGFVSFGFGLVHRAARRPHAPSSAQTPGTTAGDQLATEFAGGMRELRGAVESLGQRVSAVMSTQQKLSEQLVSSREEPQPTGESSSALFRLAAALDKLHANIDQRLGQVQARTEGVSQSLQAAMSELRKQLGELESNLEETLSRSVRSMQVAVQSAAPTPTHAPAPRTTPTPTPKTTPAPAPTTPRPTTAVEGDLYAEQAATPVHSEEDPLVREGLEAFGALEEGQEPESIVVVDEDEDHPNSEFFETVQELDSEVQEATGTKGKQSAEPAPPAPLPNAQPTMDEDSLEALLPEDALRQALDGDV